MTRPELLDHATFAPHVGSSFRVLVGDGTVVLTLVEVSDVRTTSSTEAFSLEFVGPPDVLLAQAEHRFGHDDIGEFDLFIVPVGGDADGFQYEALFNRLLPRT